MSRLFVVGNLVRDPEMKFTNSGKAVTKCTIAENYKPREGAEQVTFVDVVLWDGLGENFNQFKKGQRVFAEGRLKQSNWETDAGDKRSRLELIADNAGADCRYDLVRVEKKSTDAPKNAIDDTDEPW